MMMMRMHENCGIGKRPMIVGNECADFAVCLFNSEPQGEPWKIKLATNKWEYTWNTRGKKQGAVLKPHKITNPPIQTCDPDL